MSVLISRRDAQLDLSSRDGSLHRPDPRRAKALILPLPFNGDIDDAKRIKVFLPDQKPADAAAAFQQQEIPRSRELRGIGSLPDLKLHGKKVLDLRRRPSQPSQFISTTFGVQTEQKLFMEIVA